MPTSLKTEKCLITVYIDFKNVIEKMNIREAYQQSTSIIPNEIEFANHSALSLSNNKHKFAVPLVLGTLLLLCLLLVGYCLLPSHPSTATAPPPQKSPQTSVPSYRKVLSVEPPSHPVPKKQAIRQDNLGYDILNYYRRKTRRLSADISLEKYMRARMMLLNLSEPIDPIYLMEEQDKFKEDYNVYAYEEKPICVVVPTYNNVPEGRYAKNMDSILGQKYKNYRVIVIDDASSDNTSRAIEEYVKGHEVYREGRLKIQRNEERKMALANILDAAYNFCKPEEIFMVIDGDDYLLGRLVFKLFNYGFYDEDKWVVYSNFLTTSAHVGYSRSYPMEVIRDNEFRNVLFLISHLRAFYTKLLLLIDPEDFLDERGELFHAANDVSIFMPILEMSRHHLLYLNEISYFYNSNTGINNHQEKTIEQRDNALYIRGKPRYFELRELFGSGEESEKGRKDGR